MRHLIFDPSRQVSLLQQDMNRLLSTFFSDEPGQANGGIGDRWIPALDVEEHDDSYVVHADLPGLSEDDIEIELDDDVLRISGQRSRESEREGSGWYRSERSFGSFERSLTVPPGIDASQIGADFDRGVLELRIPKPAQEVEQRPQRIAIGSTASPHDR